MGNKVFTTKDYFNRTVSLDEDQFKDHITLHSEMEGEEESIKKTLENPDSIYQSSTHVSRDVYFLQGAHTILTDKYIKVVVDFSDPGEGFVVSAWATDKVSTSIGGPKYVK